MHVTKIHSRLKSLIKSDISGSKDCVPLFLPTLNTMYMFADFRALAEMSFGTGAPHEQSLDIPSH